MGENGANYFGSNNCTNPVGKSHGSPWASGGILNGSLQKVTDQKFLPTDGEGKKTAAG